MHNLRMGAQYFLVFTGIYDNFMEIFRHAMIALVTRLLQLAIQTFFFL